MNAFLTDPRASATALVSDQLAAPAEADAALEQQMADRGLSSETKRFLRHLHHAEKQLNDAFEKAHQGGALDQCVSEVYRDLYCSEDVLPAGPRTPPGV